MTEDDRIATVRAILFEDWDPVACAPVLPADECDSYIPDTAQPLKTDCTAEQMEAHLVWLEKRYFGEVQEEGKARAAARNLVASWRVRD